MSALFGSFAQALMGSGDSGFGNVDRWLDTLQNGTVVGDRRLALDELKQFTATQKMSFGERHMGILFAVIRDDAGNAQLSDLVGDMLEVVLNIVSLPDEDKDAGAAEAGPDATPPEAAAAAQQAAEARERIRVTVGGNAERIGRNSTHINVLLELLSSASSASLSALALDVLRQLVTLRGDVTRAMLTQVADVVHMLMGLVLSNQLLRYQAASTLGAVICEYPPLQAKVSADHMRACIALVTEREGMDSEESAALLGLLVEVLRGNVGAQRVFRAHMGKLLVELDVRRGNPALQPSLSRTHARNLCKLMDVLVMLLTSDEDTERTQTQLEMEQKGALEHLVYLALQMEVADNGLRRRALVTLGALTHHYPPAQQALQRKELRLNEFGDTALALVRLCMMSLHNNDAGKRAASEFALRAFLDGNMLGQEMLVSAITDPNDASMGNFHRVLGQSLFPASDNVGDNANVLATWAACAIMRALMHGNEQCKNAMLTDARGSGSIFQRLMGRLASLSRQSGAGVVIKVGLLRVVQMWLIDCSAATRAMLETAGGDDHVTTLLRLAGNDDEDLQVRGVACVVLGTLLSNVWSKEHTEHKRDDGLHLIGAILASLGLDTLMSAWSELSESEPYRIALNDDPAIHEPLRLCVSDTPLIHLYNATFVHLCKSVYPLMAQSIKDLMALQATQARTLAQSAAVAPVVGGGAGAGGGAGGAGGGAGGAGGGGGGGGPSAEEAALQAARLDSFKELIREQDDELRKLRTENTALQEEAAKAKAEAAAAVAAGASAGADAAGTGEGAAEREAQWEARVAALQNQLKEEQARAAAAERERGDATKATNSLKDELASIRAQHVSVGQLNVALEEKVRTLQDELAEARSREAKAATSSSQSSEKDRVALVTLQAKVKEMEEENEELFLLTGELGVENDRLRQLLTHVVDDPDVDFTTQ